MRPWLNNSARRPGLLVVCLLIVGGLLIISSSPALAQQSYAPLLGTAAAYEQPMQQPAAQPDPHALERLPTDTFSYGSTLPLETLPPAQVATQPTPGFDYVDPNCPCLEGCCGPGWAWQAGGKARAYYWNDQRWEFTGQ